MSRPKVLLVANTDWYLYRFRVPLAKFLMDRGFLVKMVSPSGPYATRFTEMGFEWLEWKVERQGISPLRELQSINHLKKIYRSEQPDIVHHHTIKPVLYGSYAARELGVKAIINSITGSGYVFMSNESKARLLRPLVLRLYKNWLNSPRTAVIFENPDDQDDFIRRGLIRPEQAWLVKGVGVDVTAFKPAPEPNGVPVVAMASRILWDKGVGVFVEAARLLKNRLPVRMVLAGLPDPDNPSSVPGDQLEAWSKENIVEWIGWQDDIAGLYAQSNIVALPSFYEGLPTSLIEAAACGRALIASDIRGCREVVEHGVNGLLVKPGDPMALAKAIEELVTDQDLRTKMGIASREKAVKTFSIDVVNQKTLEIYHHYLQ
jgi:glycosyltransferase involved in cell wall biosynthesis